MASVTFTKAGDTGWSPSRNPIAPRRITRNLSQESQETAGGTVYTYTKGAKVEYHMLRFELMSTTDKSTLETFFDDVAKGRKIVFVYNDDDSNAHTVTFAHDTLNWEEPYPHTHYYDIELVLRKAL